jgi:hypothetical protein
MKPSINNPCFMSLRFNAPCQYTFPNLCHLISGVMHFGCLCSITLTPNHSIINGNIVSDLCPPFQEQN